MANQGKRMVPEYLIKKIGEGGGSEYTAGTGIDITGSTISVDTETVTMKSDLATVATTGDYDDLTNKPTIPDAVSGTNDGTNWTSITIGDTTKAIPQGGSGSSAKKISYTKFPKDVLDEMQQTDPSATLAQAVLKWIKEMPIFAPIGAEGNLLTDGFTNVIPVEASHPNLGDYEITGVFGIRCADSNSLTSLYDNSIHIYGNFPSNYNLTTRAYSGSTYKCKLSTTYLSVYDVVSNANNTTIDAQLTSAISALTSTAPSAITISQLSTSVPVYGDSTLLIVQTSSGRYNASNGVAYVTTTLQVKNPQAGSTAINAQLALPNYPGTGSYIRYKLTVVMDENGKFNAFQWVIDN